MPPTQLHHPNRPHQENATTLTHDYAKLQAKAKHVATQIQHIVTWCYLIRQYLRLLDVISHSHDVSSTSGLPRGFSSQGTATPSRGSSGTLCSVATGCAGWGYLEVLLSDAICGHSSDHQAQLQLKAHIDEAHITKMGNPWEVIGIQHTWHTAYVIWIHMAHIRSHMSIGFGHVQSFDHLIVKKNVITLCQKLEDLEDAKCRRFGHAIWPHWGGVKSQGFRGKSWDCRKDGHGSREESTTRGESWDGTCTLPECTIPGWWPVKVYSFCNISISFLVHFHLHFYSFLFYFLPVIVHHVPSLSYHFLRCPIIVYEVANEVPNEFAKNILDGVPDEVANEVANEQTSNPQKIKLPMIITWSCTWWRNKVEVQINCFAIFQCLTARISHRLCGR